MCRGGTLQSARTIPALWLQSATSALRIHFGTLRQWCVKFLPRDFLPILDAPQPKIMNRSYNCRATKWCFWPVCDQNLGSVFLRCDHESNFWNFDLERLWSFTPMAPKVSFQDFLPLFGGPRPEIMNRSFWPACDQMVLLTGVRPKSMFSLFDCCATRKGLKNPLRKTEKCSIVI